MAKMKSKYLALIAWAAICALFTLITLLVADLDEVKASFWCAFSFTEVAFVVVGAVIALTSVKSNRPIGVFRPLYVAAGLYFLASLIINIIFMAIPSTDNVTWVIILNAIAVVALAVAAIFCYTAIRHVSDTQAEVKAKVTDLRLVTASVSALLYKTNDATIKAKLNNLVDEVKYSAPMGNSATAQAEEDIKNQIQVISTLLSEGADSAAVISAIDDAVMKVQMRNNLLMISK